jgi:hypothetical protein
LVNGEPTTKILTCPMLEICPKTSLNWYVNVSTPLYPLFGVYENFPFIMLRVPCFGLEIRVNVLVPFNPVMFRFVFILYLVRY